MIELTTMKTEARKEIVGGRKTITSVTIEIRSDGTFLMATKIPALKDVGIHAGYIVYNGFYVVNSNPSENIASGLKEATWMMIAGVLGQLRRLADNQKP